MSFRDAAGVNAVYDDLPWFLFDLRPSGFLGRFVPMRHPELGLPVDIRAWSAEHLLGYPRPFHSKGAPQLSPSPKSQVSTRLGDSISAVLMLRYLASQAGTPS